MNDILAVVDGIENMIIPIFFHF